MNSNNSQRNLKSDSRLQNIPLSNFDKFEESQQKALVSPFLKGGSHPQMVPNSQAISYAPTTNKYRTSRASQGSKYSRTNANSELMNYEKLSQLSERLKNIHHFYKIRIEEEKSKSSERNEVFMGIIEELQKNHNEKISSLQREVEEAEEQKKEVGFVGSKVNEIQGSVDNLLRQSSDFKSSNTILEKQIIYNEQVITEKEREVAKLRKEETEYRNELEAYERQNLKENKKKREMLEMIDNVVNESARISALSSS